MTSLPASNSTDTPSLTHVASLTAARNLLSGAAPNPDRELASLTGGQVADVVQLAQESAYYDPIDPFTLSDRRIPPAVEQGRLQTRLFALKAKLNQPGSHS